MLYEGALQRMQLFALRQSLDGADLLSLRLDREHQAGPHRLAVDDHRARTADAVLASGVRAQRVGQRVSRFPFDLASLAVHRQGELHEEASSSARRTTARTRSRR